MQEHDDNITATITAQSPLESLSFAREKKFREIEQVFEKMKSVFWFGRKKIILVHS